MKRILVTGGSGFVGRHLIAELLRKYPHAEVTSLSRSEGVISQLLTECPSKRLKIAMGDIRDYDAVRCAMKGIDIVIHLAAMKRVDLSEEHCQEAVTTNVIGTLNILNTFEGDTFVLMSTDKAVEPVNCYGGTKLVAEKLVQEQARHTRNGRFMIIRSGNIMGSTGSVIDIWKKQIEEKNEITVTNLEMLRFYTSVEGVIKLYLAVLERGENGKIYVTPRGEARVLRELVKETISLYGNNKTRTRVVGLRPGERMEEKMQAEEEPNIVAGFEEGEEQQLGELLSQTAK
ncbi:MAG: polysaccharide biosynthesis protein [Chloroflexi bacterium]|nr:polysaccharide biosynthesis protein [Chloroflexota bacterium]